MSHDYIYLPVLEHYYTSILGISYSVLKKKNSTCFWNTILNTVQWN